MSVLSPWVMNSDAASGLATYLYHVPSTLTFTSSCSKRPLTPPCMGMASLPKGSPLPMRPRKDTPSTWPSIRRARGTPAYSAMTANRSKSITSSCSTLPTPASRPRSAPPDRNAGTLMPPSKRSSFSPRKGALDCAAVPSPPLSLMYTMSVSSNMPLSLSLSTTRPRLASRLRTMAHTSRRKLRPTRCPRERGPSSTTCAHAWRSSSFAWSGACGAEKDRYMNMGSAGSCSSMYWMALVP
mmetsp:Transcript_17304/g.58751  ORF Transcript_17304/g.58751 Transcript_17304/m.58751 type:complete len:240 (-) Transcript_17304:159-878(-)